MDGISGVVMAVNRSAKHTLIKMNRPSIQLRAGLGVEGDAHMGETVKHRSRVKLDPSAPNLRQVHLLHAELFDELGAQGFHLGAGVMGENITTQGVDLLALPKGTQLHLGDEAIIEVTGLRNPCAQLNRLQPGLMAAVRPHGPDGKPQRKAGIMGIVVHGGAVSPGDSIRVALPAEPHEQLAPV
jgi:MOSC domain-containing protein YiiM